MINIRETLNKILSICILLLGMCSLCACFDLPEEQTPTKNSNETVSSFEEYSTSSVEEVELSEGDYKEQCREMYYDDVFFGKEDLENHYIKLHLFLSQKYYFTNEDMLKDSFRKYDKYNLNKDFFKCCVLRKDTTSYVGQQINLWFSDKNELSPNDYAAGQKITVYGEVISWSNNTMSGYNSVTIIPKYIENEE